MNFFKYLFFDCMETLIDLDDWQSPADDAMWAYQGSGAEEYWKDFDSFLKDYYIAKEYSANQNKVNQEYDIIDRFRYMVHNKLPKAERQEQENLVYRLMNTFWEQYKRKSYVREDVREYLPRLFFCNKLAVVSNFKVPGGVEELLEYHSLRHYFTFVVTSINVGWRKPHSEIYRVALQQAQTSPENVCFIGDDYQCDYLGPKKIGIPSVLLDRRNRYPEVQARIRGFEDFCSYIEA